jgi:hypothetical protein
VTMVAAIGLLLPVMPRRNHVTGLSAGTGMSAPPVGCAAK